MQHTNPWHFARPQLAQLFIQSFELGLISARGLFARRRMGKTEFLKQDFIPAAKAHGYATAYVNLWETRADPASALVTTLHQAMEPKGLLGALNKLRQPARSIRASGKVLGFGEAGIEAEFARKKTFLGTPLMDAMRTFDRKRRIKLVLILDEAQVLARESNSDFAHALRAALDIRKDRIKVLFAGSSEGALWRMFGRPSKPFYKWAMLEPFVLLGNEFVEAMVERVASINSCPLHIDDALKAFDELQRTPEFFRNYLTRYMICPSGGAQGALEHTKSWVFSDANFQRQWNGLPELDRIILTAIAVGVTDVYRKDVKERIGSAIGLSKEIDNSELQNTLDRLSDKTLITKKDHGCYQMEDEAFAEWIRDVDLRD